ncbi:MAG: thiamine phosphate synthase [Myxococcales bacterium]
MVQGPVRAERLSRLQGVYAIVDGGSTATPLALVAAFLEGGARVVQLRLKDAPAGDLFRVAVESVALCRVRGALLLVNDRPDVARCADADGVHLGQDDLPPAAAREILGPDAIVGISTHSDAEIDAAKAAGADYVGFGPVFATRSKGKSPLPPPHGTAGLRRAVERASPLPVVAIGGITVATVAEVARAGARCAAAIAELCAAPDPATRTREMARAFVGDGHAR